MARLTANTMQVWTEMNVNQTIVVHADIHLYAVIYLKPLSVILCWLLMDKIYVVAYFMVFVVPFLWSLINREHSPSSSVLSCLSVGPAEPLAIRPIWCLWFKRADHVDPETNLSLLIQFLPLYAHMHPVSCFSWLGSGVFFGSVYSVCLISALMKCVVDERSTPAVHYYLLCLANRVKQDIT